MPVTFSYDFALYPAISQVRMLIGDTNPDKPIFGDDEITGAYSIQQAQFGGKGTPSPLRVAALLLDSLASNKSRLTMTKLLDANVDPAAASKALRDQANQWRDVDDNSIGVAMLSQYSCDLFTFFGGWGFGPLAP